MFDYFPMYYSCKQVLPVVLSRETLLVTILKHGREALLVTILKRGREALLVTVKIL